jgi:hypothetical protein
MLSLKVRSNRVKLIAVERIINERSVSFTANLQNSGQVARFWSAFAFLGDVIRDTHDSTASRDEKMGVQNGAPRMVRSTETIGSTLAK